LKKGIALSQAAGKISQDRMQSCDVTIRTTIAYESVQRLLELLGRDGRKSGDGRSGFGVKELSEEHVPSDWLLDTAHDVHYLAGREVLEALCKQLKRLVVGHCE
jgi:hypothetical protein